MSGRASRPTRRSAAAPETLGRDAAIPEQRRRPAAFRGFAPFGLLLLAGLASGCGVKLEDSGSNTNWLSACFDDAGCGEGLGCFCGICTLPCDAGCGALEEATCAERTSGAHRALCGSEPGASLPEGGICLPRCSGDDECEAGSLCLEGSCLPLFGEASGCPAGSELELEGGEGELAARFGTMFSTELYVPVHHESEPEGWTEPAPPARLIARVSSPDGEPVAGCRVTWLTGAGSGWAFPEEEQTSSSGEIGATWVAGAEAEQELLVTLADEDGRVSLHRVVGRARSTDDAPQAEDEALRSTEVSPSTLWASYPRDEEIDAVRVTLTPHTFPHHAFYAALSISGFFAGLQNLSSGDAFAEETPASDRILLASVWNSAEAEAVLLWQTGELECGSHDQGEGGVRCALPDAWIDDSPRLLLLEARVLAPDEAPPEYEELGYDTAPCAGPSGCTDLTLFFGDDPAAEPRRVVAYRHPNAGGFAGLAGFLQPYARAAEQTSCLVTPRYEVSYRVELGRAGVFTPLPRAQLSATYASWGNDVCANYGAWNDAGALRLGTGGPEALGRPQGPGDPAWTLPLE